MRRIQRLEKTPNKLTGNVNFTQFYMFTNQKALKIMRKPGIALPLC